MIGALSLVIVVWLGTSMNCSRMSTLTGRSTIGIEEPQARLADHRLVRPAQPEDDHLLVLLHHPDRQVHDHQQDDDDERDDAQARIPWDLHQDAPAAVTAPATMMTASRLDDEGQPVDARRRGQGRRASSGRSSAGPRRPLLAADVDRAERLERAPDDAGRPGGDRPAPTVPPAASIRRVRTAAETIERR